MLGTLHCLGAGTHGEGGRGQVAPSSMPLASKDLARVSGHACLWYMLEHLLRLIQAGDSYRLNLGWL